MNRLMLCCLLLGGGAIAAEKPLLGVAGELVYENAFSGLPEAWKAAKGDWKSADGVLSGAEKPEDHHGAVIRMNQKLTDFIIEYQVRFDGAKGTSLSINDAKGHLARVSVTPAGMRVTKDDHDHDGPDKAVVLGALQAGVKPGVWHTVRMEIVGNELLGRVDEVIACGTHEQLAAEKSNVGLTVAGQSASFRNLKIWAAAPNPDWAKIKASLPRGEPLPPPRTPAKKPAAAKGASAP